MPALSLCAGTHGGQKISEPMELELQDVVSHHGGAGNLASNQGWRCKLSGAITEATA